MSVKIVFKRKHDKTYLYQGYLQEYSRKKKIKNTKEMLPKSSKADKPY